MDSTQNPLVIAWLELWNGDYSRVEDLIAADFQMHAAMLDGGDGSAIRGPEGLVGWVKQTRAAIPDLLFSLEIGPIVQGDHFALRWSAKGTYAGGMPGATAAAGTPISITGIDILRVENNRLVEYWVNADTLQLLAQMGVVSLGS